MSATRVGEILMYIGALGLIDFALLAVSARQMREVTITRLRRKLANPFVRHAPSIAALSAALLVAGAILRV